MQTNTTSQVDISPLLDKGSWSSYQKLVLGFAALIIIFDGLDIQVMGLAIPAMMKDWDLPRTTFALISAAGLVGMAVGTIIGGYCGDRFGRRPTLIGAVFTFSALTIATAFVETIDQLMWLRLLTGLGLGGALPNATALTAEFTPLKNRAMAVILTIVCIPIGGIIGGLLAQYILPTTGWHALFVVCGVLPAVVGVILIFMLPESPRFLVRHPERHVKLARLLARMDKPVSTEAELVDLAERDESRSQFGALFSAAYVRDTLLLWIVFFMTLAGTYLILSWLPAFLTSQKVDIGVASSGITYYNLGGMFGAVAGALLITRFGSLKIMLGLVAGGILTALYLTQVQIDPANPTPLIAAIGVIGVFMNAVQTSSYALAAHIYVSHIRATGTGAALAIGRTGAVISSFAGAFVIEMGTAAYFGAVALTLAVGFIALALISRHIPGNLSKAD